MNKRRSIGRENSNIYHQLWHDFYKTVKKVRFTLSVPARREVHSRLLKLNHERWEEEQKQSTLEGKEPKSKSEKKGKKSKSSDEQIELLL